jgi:UDP-glucose:(heptosyl)LPS alpha-1,3-glucosyltransferase
MADNPDSTSNGGAAARRLRIAVVSPFVDRKHGTERAVAEILARLASEFEFHVYSERLDDVELDRVAWHHVPALPGPHLFGYVWWFLGNQFVRWRDRRFRGLVPDLVYSPGINCLDADAITAHVNFTQLRESMRPKLRLLGNPVGSWPQIIHRRLYYQLIASLEARVYRRLPLSLATVSRALGEDLARTFERPNDVAIIYYGVGLDQFSVGGRQKLRDRARAALGLAEGDFALLLVGNDLRSKGLPCLLEAVRQVGDPRLRVLVAGNDNPAAFVPSLEKMGLAARVRFLPPRPDVEFYYAAADAYVSPSLQDAFALPPAESMACGLPVITSRNNGGSEIIHDGIDGFVLEDPTDSKTLAGVIQRLAGDAELCHRIGLAAAETVRQCSWEENARQTRELFQRAWRLKNAK